MTKCKHVAAVLPMVVRLKRDTNYSLIISPGLQCREFSVKQDYKALHLPIEILSSEKRPQGKRNYKQ